MKSDNRTKLRKTPLLVILSFLFIGLIGIAFNEPARVLELALQICLSCIGIG